MRHAAAAGSVVAFLLAGCQARDADVLRDPPRFYEDVAPILARSCTCCHRPAFDAPSLLLPEEVGARIEEVLQDVTDGAMPPLPDGPHPVTGCSSLTRATPPLTAEEIELLRRWNDQGRTAGDPLAAPPVPTDCSPPPRGTVLSIDLPAGEPADGEDVTTLCYGIPLPIPRDGVVVGTHLTTASSQLRSVAIFGGSVNIDVSDFDPAGGPCPPYEPWTVPIVSALWAGESHQTFPAGTGIPVSGGARLAAAVVFDRRFREARGDFESLETRLELDIVDPDEAPTPLALGFVTDANLRLVPGGIRSASASGTINGGSNDIYGAILFMNDYGRSIVATLGADGQTACALEQSDWVPSAVRNLMFDPPLHGVEDLEVDCTYDLRGVVVDRPILLGHAPEGELCQLAVLTPAPSSHAPRAGDLCERMWGAVQVDVRPWAPGGTFALVEDGELVCARNWGLERAGDKARPVDDQTLFRWGANSTSIAALVTLEAAARGLVDLDQPVYELLGDLDGPGTGLAIEPRGWAEQVTIRHLVERTAGLPQDGTAMFELGCDPLGPDALTFLATFRDGGRVMIAKPGISSADGRVAKVMLGAAVEAAAGVDFADLARKVLFEPLGMHDSFFGWNDRLDDEEVYGHAIAGFVASPLDRATETCDAATVPEGLTTSVADARRLLLVLARGGRDGRGRQLLHRATIDGLLRGVVPSFKQSTTMSGPFGEVFGGGAAPGSGPAPLAYREGPGPGYLTSMTISPGSGFGVFEMSNVADGAPRRSATTLATSDEGWDWPTPDYSPGGPPWQPTREELGEYEGSYVAPGQSCAVVAWDEQEEALTWSASGLTARMCPLSVDRFGLGCVSTNYLVPWISFYRDGRKPGSPIFMALRSEPGFVHYPVPGPPELAPYVSGCP